MALKENETIPNGYILIARIIQESAIWKENPHTLKLFIYLVMQARHKLEPKKYPGFEVKRGELITSLSQLSDNNEFMDKTMRKWSRMKVSRMLQKLHNGGYINILSDTYGTHIKIVNYDDYQDKNRYKKLTEANSSVTDVLQKRYGSVTDVLPYNKDKQDKNDKNVNNESIKDILSDLNQLLGTHYKHTSQKTKDLINTRFSEGFTVEDFRGVHRNMFKRWGADNKMREFLRPITLYSNKFESYLNIQQALPVSTEGAKTYMAGKEWIKQQKEKDGQR